MPAVSLLGRGHSECNSAGEHAALQELLDPIGGSSGS
jgi:hypothetical protein